MTELVPVKKQPSVDLSPKQIPDLASVLKPEQPLTQEDVYTRFRKRMTHLADEAYYYPEVVPEPTVDGRGADVLSSLMDVYDLVDESGVGSIANLINAQEETEVGTPERDAADIALSLARTNPEYATTQRLQEITNFMTFLDKAKEGNPDVGFWDDVQDAEELVRFIPTATKGLWRAVAGEDFTFDAQQQEFNERIFRGDFNDLEPEEIWRLEGMRDYTWSDNPDADISKLEQVFLTNSQRTDKLGEAIGFSLLEVTPIGLLPDAARLARGTGRAVVNSPEAFRNLRARREINRRTREALQKEGTPEGVTPTTNTVYEPSEIPQELLARLGERARQEIIENEQRASQIESTLNQGRQPVIAQLNTSGSTTGETIMSRWTTKAQRRAGEEGELRTTQVILNESGEAFTKRAADRRIDELVNLTGLPRSDFRRVKVEGNRGGFHIHVAEPERMLQVHPTRSVADMNNELMAGNVVMNYIKGIFQNPRQYMDEAYTPAMAEATENAAVEGIFESLRGSVAALTKEGASAQGVNNAIEIAILRDSFEDWMTPQTFERYFAEATGRPPTDADQALYQVFRQASDRAWRMKADADIRVMESMGGVRLSLPEGRTLGAGAHAQARPIDAASVVPSRGGVAIRNGEAVRLQPEEFAEAIKNGTVYEVFDDTLEGFRYIVDDGSALVGQIRREEIMQYIAGGRLEPKYGHYMKVTIQGEEVTLFGGHIRKELDQAAGKISELATYAREYLSIPRPALAMQSDTISNNIASLELTGISNAEDAIKYFEEVRSSLGNSATKLEDVLDYISALKGSGQRPTVVSASNKNVRTGKGSLTPEEELYSLTKKRLGFSRSSRRIRNINPNASMKHNYSTPFDALSRDLQVATRRGAVAVDQHKMLDAFYQQYVAGTGRGIYEAIGDNSLGKAVFANLFENNLLPEGATKWGVMSATKLTQHQIRHFMRYNHPVNDFFSAMMTGAGDATFSASIRLAKLNSRWLGRPVRTVSEWLSAPDKFTPIETATAFIMDAKLGILNTQQAIIQASMVPVIAASRGSKFNGRAVASTPLQTLLNMPEDAARYTASKLEGISTFTADQLMELRSLFREMGFDVYGRTHIMDDTGRAAASARLGGVENAWDYTKNMIEKARLNSRIIFKHSDMAPRVTAFIDGAADIVARGDSLTSPASKLELFNHTNKWVLGTTGVDTPVILKRGLGGAIRPMVQFMSFTFRALGAIFSKTGTFTAAEKVRMMSAYLALSGTRALPLLPVITALTLESTTDTTGGTNYQMLKEVLGEDGATLAVAIDSGLIDATFHALTGEEFSMGQRTSLDPFKQFWDTWIDNKYGTSAGSAFFGALGSTSGQFWRTQDRLNYLDDVAWNESAYEGLASEGRTFFKSLGSTITTVNAVEAYIIGHTLGELQSKSGGKLRDVTATENFIRNVFGARLKDEEAFTAAIESSEDKQELLRTVAADIARRRLSAYESDADGNPEAMHSQFIMAQTYVNYLISEHGITESEIHTAVIDQYERLGYEDVMSRVIRRADEYRERQQLRAEESEE